jgi:hypothetical protein
MYKQAQRGQIKHYKSITDSSYPISTHQNSHKFRFIEIKQKRQNLWSKHTFKTNQETHFANPQKTPKQPNRDQEQAIYLSGSRPKGLKTLESPSKNSQQER